MLVAGVGLGWSIRELRGMHKELKATACLVKQASDSIISLNERSDAAEKDRDDLRERIEWIERHKAAAHGI